LSAGQIVLARLSEGQIVRGQICLAHIVRGQIVLRVGLGLPSYTLRGWARVTFNTVKNV